MEIQTERLILRDLKEGDEKSIQENADNLNVSRYLLVVPYPYTIKDAEGFVKYCKEQNGKSPRENYELGITLKGDDRVIGMIGLTHVDQFQSKGEIGYWLGESHWRKGIMSEALEAIIKFAFDELNLGRIDISAFTLNEASNSLIKRFGFNFEGTRIKYHRAKSTGEIADTHVYGLLREDWKR